MSVHPPAHILGQEWKCSPSTLLVWFPSTREETTVPEELHFKLHSSSSNLIATNYTTESSTGQGDGHQQAQSRARTALSSLRGLSEPKHVHTGEGTAVSLLQSPQLCP